MTSDELDAIAREAGGMGRQIRTAIRRILDPHANITRLFYGGDGKLRPSAVEWLDWLAQRSFIDEPTYDPDPRAHAFNDGRRALALEILRSLRLDTRRLAALTQQLKEEDDE